MDSEKIYEKFVLDDSIYESFLTKKFKNRAGWLPEDPSKFKAFIPGTIREIFVKEGDNVKKEQKLLVLEAMKMKNVIYSKISGKVSKIHIKSDQTVMKNQLLIEFVQD